MKKLKIWSLIAILAIALLGHSCSEDNEQVVEKPGKPEKPEGGEQYKVYDVKVSLLYPENFTPKEKIKVKALSSSGASFEIGTNAEGSVVFKLPLGTYEFSASEIRTGNKKTTILNGLLTSTISNEWKDSDALTIKMQGSTRSQLILKEVYFGGCPRDNSNKSYTSDAYITLYNNSSEPVNLQNLCFGSMISNSHAMKKMKEVKEGDNVPYWFKEDWSPAAMGYFYFPNSTVLEPYKELTIVAYSAINHAEVHSRSIDLSSSSNYVMYDVDKFNQPYYYKAPSSNIPTSQYLKAVKYGLGTAWSTTTACPNLFLFYPENQSPEAYGNDKTDNDFWMNLDKFPRKKVPTKWTVDAIDAFTAGKETDNVKRINPKVDAGHVYFVSKKGYTLYRNVDKDLTEAIEGNKEKLVYNYAMGTRDIEPKYGSSDPSEIDAEASIANGATIIYKDTNNSGSDFHMRKQSTLKK